ncbi:hypothetical protein [Paenibacillus paeoniae]|uniref:Uncharacterized protein n=1 Tax=Paenibacillus paeoniae TaxID=2292705 RepID=A0A371P7L2_9BACL|nr:hypothetical protein [Paenibacillus paeoniae]REK71909.1 hypothetical protein DX130_19580 [Paenibacillus paeoniae]
MIRYAAILLCIIMAVVAVLLWHYKKRLRASEQSLLHRLLALHDIPVHARVTVIRIDYSHAAFKSIDEWLSTHASPASGTLIILLDAPEWLCGIKRKSWGNHATVLHAPQSHPAWSALIQPGYTVAEWSHSRMRRFTDQQLYLNHITPHSPQTDQEVI